jgi:hypothetical protein
MDTESARRDAAEMLPRDTSLKMRNTKNGQQGIFCFVLKNRITMIELEK